MKGLEPMLIAKDTVVSFHYRLTGQDGTELQSSFEAEPISALIGAGNIIPGVEAALMGLEAGATADVEVAPEDGYGHRNPGLVHRVPKKYFANPARLKPGMTTILKTEQGQQHQVTVVKVGMSVVDIDGNHPLAGQHLKFHVQVEDVRAASAEELAHGHAHGPGGHQH